MSLGSGENDCVIDKTLSVTAVAMLQDNCKTCLHTYNRVSSSNTYLKSQNRD